MYWIYFIIFIIWNENILYDLSTSIFYICLSLDLSYTLHEKKKERNRTRIGHQRHVSCTKNILKSRIK